MRISNTVPLAAIFFLTCAFCAAQSAPSSQTPTSAPPAAHPVPAGPPQSGAPQSAPPAGPPAPAAVPAAPPFSPSAMLQPSLDAVQQALIALKMDKWKKGTVRTETSDKIALIIKDLHETLLPLITAGDAAPGVMSKQLPVSRNLDALYDVLLRVFEAARVSAPPDQISKLDQVLAGLNTARIAYDDHLQDSALAVEKQVSDLQTTVKAQAAFKCPAQAPVVVPVCPPPPTPRPRRKPKPPATTPQTTPAPATTTSPKPGN